MSQLNLVNINIVSEKQLPTPNQVVNKYPISDKAAQVVFKGREDFNNILNKTDKRIAVVIGPCSIHDEELALEYAARLKKLSDQVGDQLLIFMRVYFSKPRTTVGWKGFINDPFLDDSFQVEVGLEKARSLLLKINEIGLPTATEALDQFTPQYIGDLISWTAIGARTTESQTHREMASGLSTPVGFKNGTDGSITVAINAIKSCSSPHSFLGTDMEGRSVVMQTKGNKYSHIVLRGGATPNYDSVNVAIVEKGLVKAGLPLNIMIDCSHGNSNKDHNLQPLVFDNCINQLIEGNQSIIGLMIESNINEGNQSLSSDLSSLKYGVSITDACINWESTEQMLISGYNKLSKFRANN